MNISVYITEKSNIILEKVRRGVSLPYPEVELFVMGKEDRISSPDGNFEKIKIKELENLSDFDLYKINNYMTVYDEITNTVDFFYKEEKDEYLWKEIRQKRNELLRESDDKSFITLPDYWMLQSEEWRTSWLNYRQDLRDITNQDDPENIIWPEYPV